MIFLKVAWQNMLKHRRRTLVILFSVTLSVTVIMFVSGMMEGMKMNFFRNMLEQSGHLQVVPEGREEALNPFDLKLLLDDPEPMVRELSNLSGTAAVEKILTFGGLLLSGDKNLEIIGCGTQKDTRFFSKATDGIYEGQFLPSVDEPGLALSSRIAKLLGVGLGDPVVVLVEDSTGSPWYVEYPVTGLFQTDSRDFDEGTFFLTHESAEELLFVPGRTREIRVILDDPEQAQGLAELLAANPVFRGQSELKTWREIHGSYLVLIDLFDIFMIFINIFTIIVVATVITNSILMNVFEHTREYGTLRAIGMKRRQLFGMILTEGFTQGLVGSLLGLAIGIPLVLYFQAHGMNWGAISESFGMGSTFTFAFSPAYAVSSLITGIVIACAGSLYAGLVTIRLSIIDSLNAV